MKLKNVLFLILSFVILQVKAQGIVKDTVTRTAYIKYDKNGNEVYFKPEAPVLNQIAGAPPAHYTYLWEFGDGDYSQQEQPKHTYKKGTYTARLEVTNNYDDGKPPKTRPDDLSFNGDANPIDNEDHKLFTAYNGARLLTNRDPIPAQEMDFIFSYGNDKDYVTNGKLYLFYNEKTFKNKNFVLKDTRTYFDEKEMEIQDVIAINNKDISSSTYIVSNEKTDALAAIDTTLQGGLEISLEEAKAKYSDYKIWSFENMQPGEERNIFNTFETTPEMIKDTSAVVTIRGIYVPDDNLEEHKVVEKEMEIVTSHDPNKMAVYNRLINYRLVRFQKMKYKIKFQNNGEGPATTIKLVTETPQMLENSSLEVLDMYPKCPICPKQEVRYSCLDTIIAKDSIIFTFKNIYLPGTAQKNVMDKDSTKGFVKYRLDFSKDFHKVTQRSKTAIIFDKNPPIITNTSVARFKSGISIGAKASYNYYLSNVEEEYDWDLGAVSFDKKAYTLTATLSPYKSYKKYWQVELGISYSSGTSVIETENGLIDILLDNGTMTQDSYFYTRHTLESEKTNIIIVPFSYRYNFNAVFGAGAGLQTVLSLSNKVYDYNKSVYYRSIPIAAGGLQQGEEITNLAVTPNTIETAYDNGFSFYNYGLFVDITAGASRIGPSGGIRYVSNFKRAEQYLQFYAIWKF